MFVLENTKTGPQQFTESMMYWQSTSDTEQGQERDAQVQEYMQAITKKIESSAPVGPKMTREDAMTAIAKSETKKMNASFKTQMGIQQGQIPKEMQGKIMGFEKIKCYDELYNELGVEENQIDAAAAEYGFKEDPEFKSMMVQIHTAFKNTIQQQMAAA